MMLFHRQQHLLIGFIFVSLLIQLSCQAGSSKYTEKLIIKPLAHGEVYTHFEFKTIWDQDIQTIQWAEHYDLFPMALGKFIAKHELQELHFSLTKGLWKHKLWGYPVRDAAPGAEIWAWFRPFRRNPEKGWKEVTSLLSGQFCASLNFIDKAGSINPRHSFRPEGAVNVEEMHNSSVYYASLPHEAVCTENLTPWKKLLPCFSKSGMASLLSATHLFNTNYFSLSLDLKPVCKNTECTETSLELVQSIAVVFNPPVMFEGKQSWSLYRLFGSGLRQGCKLAQSSLVYVDVTHNDTNNSHELTPRPTRLEQFSPRQGDSEKVFAVYDVIQELAARKGSGQEQLNIASQYKKVNTYWLTREPALAATRYISGYGVSQGTLVARISNKLQSQVNIVYQDIIPWYLRIYLHTLSLTSNGKKMQPKRIYYKPAKDRVEPHHIELLLTLEPESETILKFDFDRSFLKWTEYPPDANHGVYIGSAVLSCKLPTTANITYIPPEAEPGTKQSFDTWFIRIHTESLLVSLPTPDFTMPFNVICLVSTVISLAFGPIHNLTTRRPRFALASQGKQISLFASLRNRVTRMMSKRDKAEVEDVPGMMDEREESSDLGQNLNSQD
ncbi:GPI transamidase component PIG-T [Halotydeus destructor]|nr:GPI transamidase component PIG-T [Halotydeus destructor]